VTGTVIHNVAVAIHTIYTWLTPRLRYTVEMLISSLGCQTLQTIQKSDDLFAVSIKLI